MSRPKVLEENMRTTLVALLFTFGLTASGVPGKRADDKADVKKELKTIEGTWIFVSVEAAGKVMPAEQTKGMMLVVEGEKYSVKSGNTVVEAASLTLDPTASPKTFDSKVTEGPNKGTVILGIYEVNGDTWKVCFDPEGKKR